MLQSNTQPVYSVDADSVIGFCRYYPSDIFPRMWEVVDSLCADGRFLICEQAAEECLDDASASFIDKHTHVVVPFGDIQSYLSAVQVDAYEKNMHLVDPDETEDEGDPYVVALGLRLDGRDPQDLEMKMVPSLQGIVVTEEKPKGPGWKTPKIPNVCDFYKLGWMHWLEMLRNEGYTG